jgi:hypothetical protein
MPTMLGNYIGHRVPILNVDYEIPLVIETISTNPAIFRIENCITSREAGKPNIFLSKFLEIIQSFSRDQMERSNVSTAAYLATHDDRTSQQRWLFDGDLEEVRNLSARVAQITRVEDVSLQEPLQVLHYGPDEHFYPHYDAFYVNRLSSKGLFHQLVTCRALTRPTSQSTIPIWTRPIADTVHLLQ